MDVATRAPSVPARKVEAGRDHARRAVNDLVSGAKLSRLWLMLGWLDIRQRYRRAMIGPFWITISMTIMVGALGVLYASLFKMDVNTFIPFLAAGFAIWFLISTTLNEATTIYIQAEGIIRNTSLPISVHIFRLLWRNLITFAHNAVVMLGVYAWFQFLPSANILLVLPGLVLVLLNLTWMSLILGTLCARFRDAPPIVANLLQIAFFITPILYKSDLLTERLTALATWNPFFHLVEVVRAPLLGHSPDVASYLILLGMTLVGWMLAMVFYGRFRARIAYWL
ncbi:MAG: lipopolysaccharide transport system permease protein [Variibacter sp.]|nr:lipopolysaccharide transport system permease protein [Variibacter sp.]